METLIGVSLKEILEDIPDYQVVLQVNTEFMPYERALHVLQESDRVL